MRFLIGSGKTDFTSTNKNVLVWSENWKVGLATFLPNIKPFGQRLLMVYLLDKLIILCYK